MLKDNSIHNPIPKYYSIPDEIKMLIRTYGEEVADEPVDISKYEESDLVNGTLIDITADQFGQAPIYIGPMVNRVRKSETKHKKASSTACKVLSCKAF